MNTYWQDERGRAPAQIPFYAVIFISRKREAGPHSAAYAAADARMMELAQQQEGYLGYSSVNQGLDGIFISYWRDEASIAAWRHDHEHGQAKARAQEWYQGYQSLICRVESFREFAAQFPRP